MKMNAERVLYLDSSAIVKLVVSEMESAALRKYLRGKRALVTSALARTEVSRALLPLGSTVLERGDLVLQRLSIVRVNDRILQIAGRMLPADLRSLDAIHLATADQLRPDLSKVCTYDQRMKAAAITLGFAVVAPV